MKFFNKIIAFFLLITALYFLWVFIPFWSFFWLEDKKYKYPSDFISEKLWFWNLNSELRWFKKETENFSEKITTEEWREKTLNSIQDYWKNIENKTKEYYNNFQETKNNLNQTEHEIKENIEKVKENIEEVEKNIEEWKEIYKKTEDFIWWN